jgi:hypothetical protein
MGFTREEIAEIAAAEAGARGVLAGGPESTDLPQEEGAWDAFRKEGMVKLVNAFLKEHGWALVWTLDDETIPMRLPGAPRITRVEDLDSDDVRHLERLKKMGIE